MSVRPDSPVDTRSKNARAQARHRAKRKAYVENLENTVHQLRAALAAGGSSPDIAAQIQFLEQENARLRAESQALRAQLGASASPTTPTSSSTGVGYGGNVGGSAYGATGESSAGQQLRLPSVADAMVHNPLLLSHFPDLPKLTTESFLPPPQNLRGPSGFGQSAVLPNYFQDSDTGSNSPGGAGANSRNRYYESTSDYRRRVSQPYIVPRRDSAPTAGVGAASTSGNYDGASTSRLYDNSERISGSDSASRSSQRSYQQPQPSASGVSTPTSAEPQEGAGSYSYTHQLYNAPPSAVAPSFPPASGTASSYVFGGGEDVKPYVP
ncbi:hypothetical protein FRC04_000060 [Tulasnella sp. 424]|nr:hypothetical protein FRC04_000060 [Tulasnella sp. 424]KAG8981922.1 hypothetical protein FRC05_000064 [Tulasnella sp. 425]